MYLQPSGPIVSLKMVAGNLTKPLYVIQTQNEVSIAKKGTWTSSSLHTLENPRTLHN